MKTCNVCNKSKPLNEFRIIIEKRPEKTKTPFSYHINYCKPCGNDKSKNFSRTINGVIMHIYAHQKDSSKKRGHAPPKYSKQEFKEWVLSQPNFIPLYSQWIASDYDKNSYPSVDRINDFKGYSFDNIQLITFGENNKKPKQLHFKQVFQYDKELNFIQSFESLKQASEILNIDKRNISRYCLNHRKHYKYIFSYSNMIRCPIE